MRRNRNGQRGHPRRFFYGISSKTLEVVCISEDMTGVLSDERGNVKDVYERASTSTISVAWELTDVIDMSPAMRETEEGDRRVAALLDKAAQMRARSHSGS